MIRKGWLLMANKIVGNPTVTPMAVPDWNQTDNSKADYIKNKPITVLDYYPSNEQLEKMGEGIYLAKVEDKTIPDYMYFFSTYENWEYECPVCGNRIVSLAGAICPKCFTEMSYEDEFKHRSWTVTIISNNGIRVERKDEYRNFRNGRENYTIDWREISLNENAATKEYVDEKIKNISPGEGGSSTKSISYNDIDTTFDCGIYLVDGREGALNDDKKEMLIVSSSERGVGQFYFYDDGRIAYRQHQGVWGSWSEINITNYKAEIDNAVAKLVDSAPEKLNTLDELAAALNDDPNFANTMVTELSKKANNSDLSKVATSGSYDDLLNQPITVLEYYPSQDMVDAMIYGAYVYRSQNHTIPSIMVIAGMRYDEIIDDLGIKKYFCRQYIIDSYSGFQARERIVCEDPSYETGWEKIPISDDFATKADISNLSKVAKSGSYNDLKDKPNIPKIPDLAEVATSGSYNVLEDKPIIISTSEDGTHDYNSYTTEGVYVLLEPFKGRYKLLIVTKDDDYADMETGTWYGSVIVQYLFDADGVTKRMLTDGVWTSQSLGGISKEYVDSAIGDIETALDAIVAIQESILGVSE